MRKAYFIALCGAAALGCGDDSRPPVGDAGPMIRIDSGGPGDGGGGADANRADAGPPDRCGTGQPCDPARGCAAAGHSCQENLGGTAGGEANDPIDGAPAGVTTIDQPLFGAGYCTTAMVNLGMNPPSCDLSNDPMMPSCPECARCESLGNVGGIDRTFCARECTPSITDDPCPDSARGNYTCTLGSNFCLDGCNNDDQCRVFRIDSNMDGEIAAPEAGVVAVDRLEYRDGANHRCDMATDRCIHDGLAGAQAGDTCTWDGECEERGDCIYFEGWHDLAEPTPGRGYCTKFGCDVPGNACAGGQKCQSRGFGDGFFLCLEPCQVGLNEGMPTDPDYEYAFAQGCRPGHRCLWDGSSAMGAADGGSCIPGAYNDVRTVNIGDACTDDTTCYSPFGAGRCLGVLRGDPDTCTVLDCAAPGIPADICGAGATCMQLGGDSLCRRTCTAATDCGTGTEACMPAAIAAMLGLMTAEAICSPLCFGMTQAEADMQCRAGQTCGGEFMPGMALGSCE
jgi:hypothetical protein